MKLGKGMNWCQQEQRGGQLRTSDTCKPCSVFTPSKYTSTAHPVKSLSIAAKYDERERANIYERCFVHASIENIPVLKLLSALSQRHNIAQGS